MRHLTRRAPGIVAALAALAGCASVSRPPGGPEDHEPPVLLSVSIDTNATQVRAAQIDFQFDEVISEKPAAGGAPGSAPSLDNLVLISPRTGASKVSWHRDHITVEPRGGFKPNTAYRVTLLPGLADIRGNVRQEPVTLVFSTGASIPAFSILGRTFDWQAMSPAAGVLVEAVANYGTKDSLTYVAAADSSGQFDVGPLAAGRYLVRGFIDADKNHAQGVVEKWDTVTVEVTDHRPVVELRAIQRDSAPAAISKVEIMDSLWIRLILDKPFDPKTNLQPAFIVLKRADSTEVPVVGVMTEARAMSERPRQEAPRADSGPPKAQRPPTTIIEPQPTQAPEAKPAFPAPERNIIVHLAPDGVLKVGDRYNVSIRGIRNLVGHSEERSYEFSVQKPPPPIKPPQSAPQRK